MKIGTRIPQSFLHSGLLGHKFIKRACGHGVRSTRRANRKGRINGFKGKIIARLVSSTVSVHYQSANVTDNREDTIHLSLRQYREEFKGENVEGGGR